jgi:hypothetical protein
VSGDIQPSDSVARSALTQRRSAPFLIGFELAGAIVLAIILWIVRDGTDALVFAIFAAVVIALSAGARAAIARR